MRANPSVGQPTETCFGARKRRVWVSRSALSLLPLTAMVEKLGAEVRAGQISTGPHAGQWVATARFADWESFGKGVQGLLNDPGYLKLVGEMAEIFKLENRTIITGIDL
jgi:hypothetical protein